MRSEVKTEEMLACLQGMLTAYMEEVARNGHKGNPFAEMRYDWMIGAKELVEALIGAPVNLQKDGKVTVGF